MEPMIAPRYYVWVGGRRTGRHAYARLANYLTSLWWGGV